MVQTPPNKFTIEFAQTSCVLLSATSHGLPQQMEFAHHACHGLVVINILKKYIDEYISAEEGHEMCFLVKLLFPSARIRNGP